MAHFATHTLTAHDADFDVPRIHIVPTSAHLLPLPLRDTATCLRARTHRRIHIIRISADILTQNAWPGVALSAHALTIAAVILAKITRTAYTDAVEKAAKEVAAKKIARCGPARAPMRGRGCLGSCAGAGSRCAARPLGTSGRDLAGFGARRSSGRRAAT